MIKCVKDSIQQFSYSFRNFVLFDLKKNVLEVQVSLCLKYSFLLMTEVNSVDEQQWFKMHALLLKKEDTENKDPGE